MCVSAQQIMRTREQKRVRTGQRDTNRDVWYHRGDPEPVSFKWRAFKWRFVVADVNTPIIGMNFLSYYRLLVDLRNKRLVDGTTNLSSTEYSSKADIASIETIVGKSM